jgi:hypothetical protein
VLEELQRQAGAEEDPDWSLHHVNGTVIRALVVGPLARGAGEVPVR